MSLSKYIDMVTKDCKRAVKIEWLNPDETAKFEFTDSLYDMNVNLNVNYQNGSRRTCTVVINNERNNFPIDFNNIWIGQKFKLWMGIYIDEKTPYYFPQGVFYISNPSETYNPSTKTITINGVDKWAYLDGTLFGTLSGTYQTNVDVNLFDAIRQLLKTNIFSSDIRKDITGENVEESFGLSTSGLKYSWGSSSMCCIMPSSTSSTLEYILTAKKTGKVSFNYGYYCYYQNRGYNNLYLSIGNNVIFSGDITAYEINKKCTQNIKRGDKIIFRVTRNSNISYGSNEYIYFSDVVFEETYGFQDLDPVQPKLSPYFLSKKTKLSYIDDTTNQVATVEKPVLDCPYTAIVDRGETLADVILEYATILCANVYYDANGRFILEPMISTADDITDTNKEILWEYSVDEKTFLGLTQTHHFEKLHNDFIVLGNIVNGYQFKGRVQNRNPMSNTCVQRIGLRSRDPYEDNQYTSDEQCIELAKYYAKTDTILQKSGEIPSVPLYHFDVNKLVTVSTPNNNMSKELFLITGFSLSSSSEMSVNITSVNILKNFSVMEG